MNAKGEVLTVKQIVAELDALALDLAIGLTDRGKTRRKHRRAVAALTTACVAEAREPLVAALENYAIIENEDGNGQCLICGKIEDHKPDCLLADTAAAALAKETP